MSPKGCPIPGGGVVVVAWSQKRVGGCGWSMVVVEDTGGVGEFSAKTVSAFCQSETKSAVMESRLGPIRLARREGGWREGDGGGAPAPGSGATGARPELWRFQRQCSQLTDLCTLRRN